MRRQEKEITDPREIERILEEAQVCRIALHDEGSPYIVPLCYGYQQGVLYLHSAGDGKKMRLLASNPVVGFEVDTGCETVPAKTPCAWGMRYRSVIGSGVAAIIEGSEEKQKALDCIMRHYGCESKLVPKEALQEVRVIKISIKAMTGKRSGYP